MNDQNLNITTAPLIELARNFCITMQHADEAEVAEFTTEMLDLLPQLYSGFLKLDTDFYEAAEFPPQYLTQEQYEAVRDTVSRLYGPDDTYLETFLADMKYSDTPIAASISEGLADIFQDLYNCVCTIKESEGLQTESALATCKENFSSYWAQTLCNVMRPLNNLHFGLSPL